MSKFLRFAKPALVVAGVWSIAWSVVGLAFAVFLSLMFGLVTFPFNIFFAAAAGFGMLGFSAGAVFALALTLLERGAPTDQLQTSRVALAGAIGGAALPAINALSAAGRGAPLLAALVPLLIFAGLGTVSSLITLRLVRGPARREIESAVAPVDG